MYACMYVWALLDFLPPPLFFFLIDYDREFDAD